VFFILSRNCDSKSGFSMFFVVFLDFYFFLNEWNWQIFLPKFISLVVIMNCFRMKSFALIFFKALLFFQLMPRLLTEQFFWNEDLFLNEFQKALFFQIFFCGYHGKSSFSLLEAFRRNQRIRTKEKCKKNRDWKQRILKGRQFSFKDI